MSKKPRTLTLWASAKLNLSLEIGALRPDGYHEIRSVMQKISLFDTVRLSVAPRISLRTNLRYLPCDSRNLCVRAAEEYFKRTGLSGGVRISVQKQIPVGAGLGGGSADAAATILGLEKLYEPLPEKERFALALSLGADVPFCLSEAKTCFCEGIGEQLTPLCNAPETPYYVLLIKEGRKLSTAEVYCAFDELRKTKTPEALSQEALMRALSEGDRQEVGKHLFNQFEACVFEQIPKLSSLKESLLTLGADAALMSGAGPTIFGLFSGKKTCEAAATLLKKEYSVVRQAAFL